MYSCDIRHDELRKCKRTFTEEIMHLRIAKLKSVLVRIARPWRVLVLADETDVGVTQTNSAIFNSPSLVPLLGFKLLHFKRQLSALIRLPVQVDKIASSLALRQYFSR